MSVLRLPKGIFAGLLLLVSVAASADQHEFSIVVLPDTQLYTESYPAIIEAQMQWIVDKRDAENIIYVAHLGDLKDDINCNNKQIAAETGGPRTEWDIIDQAFIKLENETSAALPNGIPFGTVAGNHDFEPFPNQNGILQCPNNWGDPAQRVLTNYIQRFGPLAPPNGRGLSGRAYYGGTRPPNSVTEPGITFTGDNYSLFESNGIKFIAINLAYRELETLASPPPEQQWASQKLQEFSDRIGIVTSHFIMECNYSTAAPTVAGLDNFNGDPWNGCNRKPEDEQNGEPGDEQNAFSEWGAQLYQSLKGNPNLFMMLGAHRRGEAYRLESRTDMQPVHVMLANYQNTSYPSGDLTDPATFSSLPPTDPRFGYGNSGFMRIMRFDVDNGTVDIETFSPPVPQTDPVTGTLTVANCQNSNRVFQPTDTCSTPGISARDEVKSVFTPANPGAVDTLHTGTASNFTGLDFTGYAAAITPDTPDAFSFIDATDVAPNTAITSNAITVSGINTAVDISIVGGEYSIDGGAFTGAAGTVNNDQSVRVRVISSTSNSTTTSATLTIGGVNGVFNVTTASANLGDIQLSTGNLDQIFQPSNTSYTSTVGFLLGSIQITATTEDENSTMSINGISTVSGQVSDPIMLSEGSNLISIVVTSANATTTETYTLNVTRQALGAFAQTAYVKASNTEAGDAFGHVALSGDTLVVGATGEDSNGTGINPEGDNSAASAGAVYVFTRSTGVWTQQAYLKASNTDATDSFGLNLALSGDTLVVGARAEDSNGTGVNPDSQGDNSASNSGAVYVFTRSDGEWNQQAYIKASNPGAGDLFGGSLALSGDTLVVGATGEDSNGMGVNPASQGDDSAFNAGAVYVFTRSAGVWAQQAYIKASNTDATDLFGGSVALSGDTLVVGARFEDSNGTGVNPASQGDNFASNSGAVYVFTRSAGTWNQQAYIKASNNDSGVSNIDSGDQFGFSVAVSGDTLVVGAPFEDSNGTGVNPDSQGDNSATRAGAAYVFTRIAGEWAQQAYIKASNTDAEDQFGSSVALSGETLAVGADDESGNGTGVNPPSQEDDSAGNSGAVYVFTRSAGVWNQRAYIKASNTDAMDAFGNSVALSGDTLAVGAVSEESNGTGINPASQGDNSATSAGAVYVLR